MSLKFDVGTTYENRKGNLFTVVGTGKKGTRYITCSICSKDEELYPNKVFRTSLDSIRKGSCPCGCSIKPEWTETQNIVRIGRIATQRGYELLGWRDGEYLGDRTYLVLKNSETGFIWDSTILSAFIQTDKGDPNERSKACIKSLTKSDEDHISEILSTGKFDHECSFERLEYSRWKYTCGVCKDDAYCKEGLCTGEWIRDLNTFKIGTVPCRCDTIFRYTIPQREFCLKNLAEERGHILVAYDHDNQQVTVNYCGEHIHTTSVSNYWKGIGCITCGKKLNLNKNGIYIGFYENRVDEVDNLYFATSYTDDPLIKVGRSFDPSDRSKELYRYNKFNIEYLYEGRHEDIFKFEQEILYQFKNHRVRRSYSTELILPDRREDVLLFIADNHEEYNLKRKPLTQGNKTMQCICGRFFKSNYNLDPKYSRDLCPKCLEESCPQSYTSSKEYVCDNDREFKRES